MPETAPTSTSGFTSAQEATAWIAGTDMPIPAGLLSDLTMIPASISNATSPQEVKELEQRLDKAIEQANEIKAKEAEEKKAQEMFDIADGNAVCDCEPGTPCCMKSFILKDAKDASRYVKWPVVEGKPDTLFMTCKDPYKGCPSNEVWAALLVREECKIGKDGVPCLQLENFADSDLQFSTKAKKVKVTSPFQMPAISNKYLPEEAAFLIYILAMFISAKVMREKEDTRISVVQCCGNSSTIKVVALPHMNVNSSIGGSVSLQVNTFTGIQAIAALTGNMKAEIGDQVITLQESTSVRPVNSSLAKEQKKEGDNLFLELIDIVFGTVEDLGTKAGNKYYLPAKMDDDHGTGLTLTGGLQIGVENFSIKPNPQSPDLQLSCGKGSISFLPKITGQVDLVDLFIGKFPGGSRLRKALEDGESVRASVVCMMTLSGAGDIEYSITLPSPVTFGNETNFENAMDAVGQTFGGVFRFTGQLRVEATCDVEVWMFDVGVAAGGSASTGWHFGLQKTNGRPERLQYFEGLIFQGYALVRTKNGATGRSGDVFHAADDNGNGALKSSKDKYGVQTNLAKPKGKTFTLIPEFPKGGNKNGWKPA